MPASSADIVTVLSDIAVSIPSPAANVKVCPVVKVSFEPAPLLIVNDDETVAKLNCPEPSVCKNWLAEPSAVGKLIPSKTILPLPFGVIVISPFVFSEVMALPSTLILST